MTQNSLERVLTTLGHKEPDRVPMFLLLTMHGAKELGITIKDYFSKAENVMEGQLRLRRKFQNDCIYAFFYAPAEYEAWGGEVIYVEDGPPNSSFPVIKDFDSIMKLEPPRVQDAKCLLKVLKAIEMLKEKVQAEAPIIGVVMSPFSLPVMQMGFERYLQLIYEHPRQFEQLMKINIAFCAEWANAQLAAGATAICYFDPVSSPTIIPPELYLKTGFMVSKTIFPLIKGPTATHLASGRTLPIIPHLCETGTAVVGFSYEDDLVAAKTASRGKITLLGNLNGIAMADWQTGEAEIQVKQLIKAAAPGGGFILSDNHGEIPFQVSDDTLLAISDAVRKWGQYPITSSENE